MKEYKHSQSVVVKTPSKLILSGEYAVIYGKPAIATAISRYLWVEAHQQHASPPTLNIELKNLRHMRCFSAPKLTELRDILTERYQHFTAGKCPIHTVLQHPIELLAYTVALFLEQNALNLDTPPQQLTLKVDSLIPLGCGMGSSAACIIGILTALCHLFNCSLHSESLYRLAHSIENLQHGCSSGLDIRIVQLGGTQRFEQGQVTKRPTPSFKLHLIHTGQPTQSTGRCVEQVKPQLENKTLLEEFAAITTAFDQALCNQQPNQARLCLRENHQLLTALGVVPKKVQEFITQIERIGGAAKICGAGSIQGDQAGIVLAISDNDLSTLCHQYGYSYMDAHSVEHGSHIVTSC